MSLVLNTNVTSLIAQNNLTQTTNSLDTSLQRLSSGLRINSAADDPAGLVISQQQGAQIAGLQAAIQNTTTAGNLVQTADGALNEINTLLTQVRSLAVSSANSGVNDANALAANQSQVANALSTINRIASTTQFNGKNLLDGSAGLTGATDNSNITFLNASPTSPTGSFAVDITTAAQRANTTAGTAQTGNLATNENLTVNGVSIALTAGETQAQVIGTINQYTGQTGVTAQVGTGGATQLYSTQFGSAAKISVQSDVAAGADSSGFGTTQTNVQGVDVAGTLGGFAASGNGNVLTGTTGAGAAGISVSVGLASGSNTTSVTGAQGNATVQDNSLVFQIGANANQTASIAINSASTTALGLNVAGSQFANLSQVNVQSQAGAQSTILTVDQAINDVSSLAGTLGAFQEQTLQATSNNLNATLQNTTAAQSTIQDTDFAAETANYTKEQVLLQAGTTVLSNANQIPQNITALLQKL